MAVNHERGEIKKKISQVDYNTTRANAKKASREGLIKELKTAKEELLKSAQDEHKKETTGDPNMDKVRNDTAAQIHHLIDKNTLPTPRAGTRENPDELVIYESELQSLAQETRDKLTILAKIQDEIEKVGEEETQVKEELT